MLEVNNTGQITWIQQDEQEEEYAEFRIDDEPEKGEEKKEKEREEENQQNLKHKENNQIFTTNGLQINDVDLLDIERRWLKPVTDKIGTNPVPKPVKLTISSI